VTQQPDPSIQPLSRIQLLGVMGVTAVIFLVIAKLWLRLSSVSLLNVSWDAVAILIGVGLGLAITTASFVVYRLWPAYRRSSDFYLEFVLKPLLLLDIIWVGLLPGLSEELLFRGVMLPAIGLNVTGVVVTSLCFGILHLSDSRQWPYVIWATIVGVALGLSAVITHNLLVPIVAHTFTNLISSYLWKLGHSK
jgi:uncharacterized protein